jgi:hypothetical protein
MQKPAKTCKISQTLQIVFPNPFQLGDVLLVLWSSGVVTRQSQPAAGMLISRALPVDQSSTDYVPILKAHLKWCMTKTPRNDA